MEKQSDVALGCEEGDRGNCGSYTQVCTSKIRLGKAWKRNLENTRNQNQKVKPKGCWNMKKAISFELSPHAHGFTLMPWIGKKPWQIKYVKRCWCGRLCWPSLFAQLICNLLRPQEHTVEKGSRNTNWLVIMVLTPIMAYRCNYIIYIFPKDPAVITFCTELWMVCMMTICDLSMVPSRLAQRAMHSA